MNRTAAGKFDFDDTLSDRQRDVLHLLVSGRTTAEISRKLDLTIYTVKQHLKVAARKLRARNRTHLAVLFDRGYR